MTAQAGWGCTGQSRCCYHGVRVGHRGGMWGTMISVRNAPPNSVVLVEDLGGGDIPFSLNGSLVASTGSCIAIGCRAEDDGETEIVIDDCDRAAPSMGLVFDGMLQTGSLRLVVRTVLGTVLLEAPVSGGETRVSIRTDDTNEPERIVIGVRRDPPDLTS